MYSITSLKNTFSNSNIIPIVTLTIASFIFLVIFIFLNYSFYLIELEEVLAKAEIESKKMQLNSELIELARSRTRITSKIINIQDPFKQDELNQELEGYADKFARLRQKLLLLPLSSEENKILKTHKEIIPIILPSQRKVVESIMHGTRKDKKEAKKILYDIVLPLQGKFVTSFKKLILLEQNLISELSQRSLSTTKNMQQRNYAIIASVLFIIVVLSAIVIIRINTIQNNLRTTHTKLEQSSLELEQKVEERTKQLSELNSKLKDASQHDELTNIYNRRKFNDFIKNEYHRTNRLKTEFSLILIDIDYFKQFNDNYDHQKGDDVLVSVAAAMSASLPRASDFIARYGGEEFVAILPSTDLIGAEKVAECLRQAVLDEEIPHQYSKVSPYVSISLGLSTYHANDTISTNELIKNADQCLYAAKAKGRNQVASKC